MIDFEADNYDDLLEKFKEKYRSLWEDFIYEQYQEHIADLTDHAKERELEI